MHILEAIQQTIVVYPGRYHPFHKGHASVYQYLKGKYKTVYIATSNKVDPPKSPFNFVEKRAMMLHAGIPADAIVQTIQPYRANEIVSQYDPKTTVLIFAISEKDMAENPRFSFAPKKDGSPSYFQPLSDKLETLDKHGYITTVPTLDFTVLGKPMRSATEFRRNFTQADEETQVEMIKDLYGSYSKEIHDIMANRITEAITKTPPYYGRHGYREIDISEPEKQQYSHPHITFKGDPYYGHSMFGGNKGVVVKAYKRLTNVIDGLKELDTQKPIDKETKKHVLQQIGIIREKLNAIQTEARLYKAWNVLKEAPPVKPPAPAKAPAPVKPPAPAKAPAPPPVKPPAPAKAPAPPPVKPPVPATPPAPPPVKPPLPVKPPVPAKAPVTAPGGPAAPVTAKAPVTATPPVPAKAPVPAIAPVPAKAPVTAPGGPAAAPVTAKAPVTAPAKAPVAAAPAPAAAQAPAAAAPADLTAAEIKAAEKEVGEKDAAQGALNTLPAPAPAAAAPADLTAAEIKAAEKEVGEKDAAQGALIALPAPAPAPAAAAAPAADLTAAEIKAAEKEADLAAQLKADGITTWGSGDDPGFEQIRDMSGNIIQGGMQPGVKYAMARDADGNSYLMDKSRESNPDIIGKKDHWGTYNTPTPKLTDLDGKPITDPKRIAKILGSGALGHSPQQLTQMKLVKMEKNDPELVKKGLNLVPIEVDQHGVGSTFATQASVDATNRKKRRQAYMDDDPRVDFSLYSPEEIAVIEADAEMDEKSFGLSILDQMEERTGADMSFSRDLVNKTGGIGWSDPKADYDKKRFKKGAEERLEKYRNADAETQARIRDQKKMYGSWNKNYAAIDKQTQIDLAAAQTQIESKLAERKERINEAENQTMWDFLYRQNDGKFWRGIGSTEQGHGLGALGKGVYLSWKEGMAQAFAGDDGKIKQYKVKPGLNIVDVEDKDFADAKAQMGFQPWEYSADPMFAGMLTMMLKDKGYDGVVSDNVATGIVIFDESNVTQSTNEDIEPASQEEWEAESTAPGKLGDCFPVAGRAMLHLQDEMETAGYKMVHALVRGEGKLTGRRFAHAFNRLGNVIFDNSNGNKIMMREENYFKQGGIDPNEKGAYVEYDKEQSLLKLAKHHHWGPWDLNATLEETIPDESAEVGTKHVSISHNELDKVKNELGLNEFKIEIPVDKKFNLPRSKMPQVHIDDYPEFFDYLSNNGATFSKEKVSPRSIKPMQGEFAEKGVITSIIKDKLKKPVIASSDNYIIDGHHRWLAALNTNQNLLIYRVSMTADKLLQHMLKFSKTYFKDIYDIAMHEINENDQSNYKPKVFVDMDGVLANFFDEWEKIQGVSNWRDVKDPNEALKALAGTDFFATLPKFSGKTDELVTFVNGITNGNWYILSAPLRWDIEGSTKHKQEWLSKNLPIQPKDAIFDGMKERYAIDKMTGQPNILIDDHSKYIKRWTDKGGIGIQYKARTDSLEKVKQFLEDHLGTMRESAVGIITKQNTTKDVKSGEIQRQGKKFGFNIDKKGRPPLLHKTAAKNSNTNTLFNIGIGNY